MKFKDFRRHFSSARVGRYLTATRNNQTRAGKLYKANLKLAQAFHPLLSILEVIIRNQINDILVLHFKDNDWIINENSHTGFIGRNQFLAGEISKADKRLRKSGVGITSGRVIAEQTLGFWTALFEVRNYKDVKGKPIQIFKKLPTGYGRKEVYAELNKIRIFRNRINHNEPICFDQNLISFTRSEEVYEAICNILHWIDPEIIIWMKDLDKVSSVIESAKKI